MIEGLGVIGFVRFILNRVYTCLPKPYKIVGYDPLITGSKPEDGRFLDPQVGFIGFRVQGLG